MSKCNEEENNLKSRLTWDLALHIACLDLAHTYRFNTHTYRFNTDYHIDSWKKKDKDCQIPLYRSLKDAYKKHYKQHHELLIICLHIIKLILLLLAAYVLGYSHVMI